MGMTGHKNGNKQDFLQARNDRVWEAIEQILTFVSFAIVSS